MTLPFNPFTIHDLVALIATAGLACMFLTLFATGRRKADLLVAAICACQAIVALAAFITDNLVPAGTSSMGVPGRPSASQLAQANLLWSRVSWSVGALSICLTAHLVLHLVRPRWARRWLVALLYAVYLACIPPLWTPQQVAGCTQPYAPTSSWECTVPWYPVVGLLPAALVASSLIVQIGCAVLLVRHRNKLRAEGFVGSQAWLLVAAMVMVSLVTAFDGGAAVLGFEGPATIPLGAMIMCALLAAAMVRQRANRDRATQERLAQMNQHLVTAREEERAEIAKELHDTLAQSLVALQLLLARAASEPADAGRPTLVEIAADRCAQIVREARQISHRLYPPELETLGVAAALERLGQWYRDAGVQCNVAIDEICRARRPGPLVEIALLRIAQEAVSNAVRHAECRRIEVKLDRQGQFACLRVTDDGRGLNTCGPAIEGLGMTTMRTRAEALGGELRIASQPGLTKICAVVPLIEECDSRPVASAPARV